MPWAEGKVLALEPKKERKKKGGWFPEERERRREERAVRKGASDEERCQRGQRTEHRGQNTEHRTQNTESDDLAGRGNMASSRGWVLALALVA